MFLVFLAGCNNNYIVVKFLCVLMLMCLSKDSKQLLLNTHIIATVHVVSSYNMALTIQLGLFSFDKQLPSLLNCCQYVQGYRCICNVCIVQREWLLSMGIRLCVSFLECAQLGCGEILQVHDNICTLFIYQPTYLLQEFKDIIHLSSMSIATLLPFSTVLSNVNPGVP